MSKLELQPAGLRENSGGSLAKRRPPDPWMIVRTLKACQKSCTPPACVPLMISDPVVCGPPATICYAFGVKSHPLTQVVLTRES